MSGRDRLLPIVGFSNLHSLHSFWRFNPQTCKFNTGGPLPYYKVGQRLLTNLYIIFTHRSVNLLCIFPFTKACFQTSQRGLLLSIATKYAAIFLAQSDVASSQHQSSVSIVRRAIRYLHSRCHVFDREEFE